LEIGGPRVIGQRRVTSAKTVVALALVIAGFWAAPARAEYFDAHNHFTGILPYYAYANLPAFIESLSNPRATVSFDDRLALYRYLDDNWYASEGKALGDRLFSPADGQRFALGARAALVVYHKQIAGSAVDLDGVLERVLTATPWSEFDSAYAFRGGPASEYLVSRFYGGSYERLSADLCKATILDLAQTNIDVSEQSLPFVGGWKFTDGASVPLTTIECVLNAPSDLSVRSALRAMNRPMPTVKIVLMTHTAQLATLADGTSYSEWSKSGACAPVKLPGVLVTTPKMVYDALMGWNNGKLVVSAAQAQAYYDTVVGIDTAGPETTCFTPAGMQYYAQLIDAVYRASKSRRLTGWHGKLLVHTHVGEGAVIDYAPTAPAQPWSFANTFAALPPTRSNAEQAQSNITTLLAAIARFAQTHPDLHRYVVFRLAHDTWASAAQAQLMHDERVEADVNLESNVATGAYPIARMPLGAATIVNAEIDPLAANATTNFELNNLMAVLVKNPADPAQVGGILGNTPLRFLLESHVRCLLGTDADGVEHSDIVKEYAYASSLIAYWNATDPAFRARAGGIDGQTLFENVRWHRAEMASDTAGAY
jgi:hypothetical protein